MATLNSFANRIDKLQRDLSRKANDIAKRVAAAVLRELVVNTPVDTSQAVSNWQIGYGGPNFTNLPPHFPGLAGSTRGPSSAETLAVGRIYIQGKVYGVPIHISNGLDYIDDINIASSMPGFLAKGIAAGNQALATAKIKY